MSCKQDRALLRQAEKLLPTRHSRYNSTAESGLGLALIAAVRLWAKAFISSTQKLTSGAVKLRMRTNGHNSSNVDPAHSGVRMTSIRASPFPAKDMFVARIGGALAPPFGQRLWRLVAQFAGSCSGTGIPGTDPEPNDDLFAPAPIA
ncbi:hypothetical protein [Xanthobacter agilis]|jgi:hypothetical protein|uniref:Uncharacterized protein n=1 Tax=Xanthobacter agilis TaxID=47492 RepID=A0ABU0LHV7_XANAG|nr:hypothetical protein [Xanthobacter agilis]MDQ0506699.1 hypothetical protein [Xanthobacter agilis]